MKNLLIVGLTGLLCSPVLHAAEPEFIALQVPPGKSAADLKPRMEARADQPIVLELSAHRHADGILRLQCDQHTEAPGLSARDEAGAAGGSE